MKVAVFCPYSMSYPGGVQNQCIQEVEYLAENHHEVHFFAPDAGDAWLKKQVEVFELGKTFTFHSNGSFLRISNPFIKLQNVLNKLNEMDILHIHEPFYPLTIRILYKTDSCHFSCKSLEASVLLLVWLVTQAFVPKNPCPGCRL